MHAKSEENRVIGTYLLFTTQSNANIKRDSLFFFVPLFFLPFFVLKDIRSSLSMGARRFRFFVVSLSNNPGDPIESRTFLTDVCDPRIDFRKSSCAYASTKQCNFKSSSLLQSSDRRVVIGVTA